MIWCFIFTVISTWCNLCEIYSRICLLSRPQVVTEPGLHRRSNDNFRWRHRRRSWHCDSSRFSTHYAMSLCNVLSRDLLSSEYRKDAPWLARKGEVLLLIHNMICALAFSFSVIFDIAVYSTYSGYIRPRYNASYISHMMLPEKFCIVISARCTCNLCEILS